MDFTKQLANLQKTASNAASSVPSAPQQRGRPDDNRRRPRGGDDRPSHDSSSSSRHYSPEGDYRRPHNKRQRHGGRGVGGGRRGRGGGRGGGRGYYPRDDRRDHHRHWDRGGGGRHDRNEAAALRRALESLPPYRPPVPVPVPAPPLKSLESGASPLKHRRHTALLFLTIDDLPYEHIWRAWANPHPVPSSSSSKSSSSSDNMLVSVLCHAKFPERIKSSWLRKRLLLEPPQIGRGRDFTEPKFHTHRPEWGSVGITRGMVDLLREGLKIGAAQGRGEGEEFSSDERYCRTRFLATDLPARNTDAEKTQENLDDDKTGTEPQQEQHKLAVKKGTISVPPVDRFIFVSETCIPVTTLHEAELALFGERVNSQEKQEGHDVNEVAVSAKGGTAENAENEQAIVQNTGSHNDVKAPSSTDTLEDTATPTHHTSETDKSHLTSETNKSGKTTTSTSAAVYNAFEKSWVNARNTPNNGYARQLQWDRIHSSIPKHCIWKADQWIVLTRPHASAVIHDIERHLPRGTDLWRSFKDVKASDEMYFPTALALLRIVRERQTEARGDQNTSSSSAGSTAATTTSAGNVPPLDSKVTPGEYVGDEVIKRRVTYADWSESARNPASFTRGVIDLQTVARLARKEGCLFARKFFPYEVDAFGRPREQVPKDKGTAGDVQTAKEGSERISGEQTTSGRGMITIDEWEDVMRSFTAGKV